MSFLYPLAWLGLLVAALPLWLHLRIKTDRAISFSAVRFLEDASAPRARGLRIRDLLLLALRLLALFSIVAAFAWPYREDDRAKRIAASHVHILDSTLSQRVGDRFLRDRDRVLAALRRSGPEVENAVVVLEARPRLLKDFRDPIEPAEEELLALKPSYERGSYLDSFRLAQTVLSRALGKKLIVVHGDHQENQWRENESTPPFLEDVEVELAEPPEGLVRSNVSIADPVTRRVFVGERTFVDLTAGVHWLSEGGGQAGKPTVVVEANGVRILEKTVALAPPSGQMSLQALWESKEPNEWIRGKIAILDSRDELPADDAAYFFVPAVREGRVGLLARSRYLKAALSPETMRGRWSAELLDPSAHLAEVPEEALGDVLVLEASYAQSEQVRALVYRHLNAGRGVILIVERMTPLLKGFLAELGLEPVGRLVSAEGQEGFRYVATRHPVFSPFVQGELGNLLDVRVLAHRTLRPTSALPLLYGSSGDGLLFEGAGTKGRLLVFPFAFERTETNWPLEPTFVPFLDLALQYVRGASDPVSSFPPGTIHVHELPRDHANVREIVLRSREKELSRHAVDEGGRALLTLPAEPGLYDLTHDDNPAVRAVVSVNPPAKESVLRYLPDPPALEAWKLPEATSASAPEPTPLLWRSRAYALEERWWYWLLLLGALALVVEMGLLSLRGDRA